MLRDRKALCEHVRLKLPASASLGTIQKNIQSPKIRATSSFALDDNKCQLTELLQRNPRESFEYSTVLRERERERERGRGGEERERMPDGV